MELLGGNKMKIQDLMERKVLVAKDVEDALEEITYGPDEQHNVLQLLKAKDVKRIAKLINDDKIEDAINAVLDHVSKNNFDMLAPSVDEAIHSLL